MTFLDIIRKQLVGKTIVSIDGNANKAGCVISEIYLDNYEPMFILSYIDQNGKPNWTNILEDWQVVVKE